MSDIPRDKTGYLARALASGQPAAEAAASFGFTVGDVARLMDDRHFLDLVAGWRGYLAASSEEEQLKHLYIIASAVLRDAAARADPVAIAALESIEEESERGAVH